MDKLKFQKIFIYHKWLHFLRFLPTIEKYTPQKTTTTTKKPILSSYKEQRRLKQTYIACAWVDPWFSKSSIGETEQPLIQP